MKHLIAAVIIIFLGISSSYASNWMLLHVGQPDGSNGGGGGGGCAGVIDSSVGCPLPMLGS